MLTRVLNAVLYFLSGFVPRNHNKVLFGSWMGHKFADNPKYLLLYLANNGSGFDLVWCGHTDVQRQIPAGVPVRFVRYGSLAAMKEMLTAGSCFVTHGFRDVTRFNLLRGATLAYVGHGVAIKRMGSEDRPLGSRLLSSIRRMLRSADSFSYYIAASMEHRRKLLTEYAVNNIRGDRVLDVGQPRVDFLLDAIGTGRDQDIRSRFCDQHELPFLRKVIAYLPTFRDRGVPTFSFARLTGEVRSRLEDVLEKTGSVLVEKSHFQEERLDSTAQWDGCSHVIQLNDKRIPIDTQELLLATDLLITDYSGCYLDYLILDRPVIHFAYDHQRYSAEDRGLYFDLAAVAAGPVVSDFAELLCCIDRELMNPEKEHSRRERVRRSLLEFERGDSSQRLAELIGARRSQESQRKRAP